MNDRAEIWLQYAAEDLAFAKAGLRDGFNSHVCFLAQQAIEKTLKALLVAQDKLYPKSHDLLNLYQLVGKPSWLHEFESDLALINLFYVPIRYPDALPGSLPDRHPGTDDANTALKTAEAIFDCVSRHMRS